jgi:8-oxo-dGTP diphosphatase
MVVGVDGEVAAAAVVDGALRPGQVQRFGAYGLVTDPAGRILLTLISSRYPGAGRWHLPGGGTDFGETATAGVLREIEEESGQRGRVTGLLGVSHRHNAREFGPEGRPMDWHTVRAVYSVAVDEPTTPVVHDVGGSTADAAWFAPGDLGRVRLTEMASTFVALSGTTPHR